MYTIEVRHYDGYQSDKNYKKVLKNDSLARVIKKFKNLDLKSDRLYEVSFRIDKEDITGASYRIFESKDLKQAVKNIARSIGGFGKCFYKNFN